MTSAASHPAMVIERDGVVLDLDGVLVDSTVCVERHHREWAPRHGPMSARSSAPRTAGAGLPILSAAATLPKAVRLKLEL